MPFAMDPSVFQVDDGSFWLIHRSHAKGIVNVELDPATGYLKLDPESKMWSPADPRFTTIANYGGSLDENNVEAAYLYKSGNLIFSTISMMQNRMMTPVR